MSDQDKYRQLGLFSVIIGEVVISPCLLGGIAYWFSRDKSFQIPVAAVAAVIGLGVAFYRISLLRKTMDRS